MFPSSSRSFSGILKFTPHYSTSVVFGIFTRFQGNITRLHPCAIDYERVILKYSRYSPLRGEELSGRSYQKLLITEVYSPYRVKRRLYCKGRHPKQARRFSVPIPKTAGKEIEWRTRIPERNQVLIITFSVAPEDFFGCITKEVKKNLLQKW